MTRTSARQPTSRDPLYDTVRQAARRLTVGIPTLHQLINAKVIPPRLSTDGAKSPSSSWDSYWRVPTIFGRHSAGRTTASRNCAS
jgi:hypothetical protein